MRVLMLANDAGHGGSNSLPGKYDPGAVAGGLTEADIALQWALTGKYMLPKAGIGVWLSRDDDQDAAPLAQRDERARAAGCSHYLSIHCNAGGWGATGTETFYRDAVDRAWAEVVQRAALKALGLRDRGVKHESLSPRHSLSVMDFPGPTALLELGFITNSRDRRRMVDRNVRVAFWSELIKTIRG